MALFMINHKKHLQNAWGLNSEHPNDAFKFSLHSGTFLFLNTLKKGQTLFIGGVMSYIMEVHLADKL